MELFFITGFGKSGTTWLQHALNKKKEIICRGEGRFIAGFKNVYPSVYDLIEPGLKRWYKYHSRRKFNWVGLDDKIVTVNKRNFILDSNAYNKEFSSDMASIIESIMLHFANKYTDENTLAVGDKTPINYMEDFLKLRRIFPDKKIVVMQRDLPSVFLARIYGWYLQNNKSLNPEKTIHPHFKEKEYIHMVRFLDGEEDYIANPETVINFSEIYCNLYKEIYKDTNKNPTKIISFNRIIEDPTEILLEIFDFLKINYNYNEIGKIVESCEKGKIKELSGNINDIIDFSNHEDYLSKEMLDTMNNMVKNYEI